jgi:hypothetical protein
MEEFLVTLACLSAKGCNETWNQYYNSKPDVRQIVLTAEHRAKAMAGPFVYTYVAPLALLAAGKDANVKIYANFSLKFSTSYQGLLFTKEF